MEVLYTLGHLDRWNLIILAIVTFFCFYMVQFWEYNSRWTDCFVLCSNVVWNPFLMKTTFTSDFSWFESVFGQSLGAPLFYINIHIRKIHRIMFSFFLFVLQHVEIKAHSLCFQATELLRWIFQLKWQNLKALHKQFQDIEVEMVSYYSRTKRIMSANLLCIESVL